MSVSVLNLLKRARSAPAGFSALDAVMGRDWAIVEAGRARRHREMETGLALKAAHQRNVDRMFPGKGGRGGGASGGGGFLPGRRPQAVVKMIRGGGTSDVRGMQAQMEYLSRDGKETLERSEAFGAAEIDADEMAAMQEAWRMPPEGAGRADRTSHFLASFPEGTDPEAAHRAGRAWAEEMFGSGKYGGDSYDYYTAFHTDRAHPHLHVVVYRRGIEHGEWLKVSQRGDMNYDTMREVLVDVAAREGIELEATTRLARAVHDRPVPDAEYRRAGKEDREPVPPAHTRRSAILAAAALMHQSRRFATQAQLVEGTSPETAAILYAASRAASHGGVLAAITRKISTKEDRTMSARVEAAKTEIRDNIEKMDRSVERVGDATTRMRLAREIAGLKAETAPIMADARDLAPFTQIGTSGRYRGFDAGDPNAVAVRQAVEVKVRAVAVNYGVDADATVERYAGPVPSKGLEQQFVHAEGKERARTRESRGMVPEDARARDVALSKMHREIETIYDAARSRVRTDERPQPNAARPAASTGSAQNRMRRTEAQEVEARAGAAQDADLSNRQGETNRTSETRAAAEREEAKRQQDRADAERSKRERDGNGRGL